MMLLRPGWLAMVRGSAEGGSCMAASISAIPCAGSPARVAIAIRLQLQCLYASRMRSRMPETAPMQPANRSL
ncbi:MAG: hypothetical protein M0Q51_09810 [Bacteroidales bacterium]|nr:hypothetical protein [Bacteroidales bacterium]